MKNRLISLLALFVFGLCTASPQMLSAGDIQKNAAAYPTINPELLKKIEPKKRDKRLQPQSKRDMLLRMIDIGRLTLCSGSPSCNDADYELSASPCDEFGSSELFPEGCYICSLKSEIRSLASCIDGFEGTELTVSRDSYEDGVIWYDHIGYSCRSECREACDLAGKYGSKCTGCPRPSDVVGDPCPTGWELEINDLYGSYSCHYRVNAPSPCWQCGSQPFGDSTGNGDIFCAPWPPRPAEKK